MQWRSQGHSFGGGGAKCERRKLKRKLVGPFYLGTAKNILGRKKTEKILNFKIF